jgi:hypothetical protein
MRRGSQARRKQPLAAFPASQAPMPTQATKQDKPASREPGRAMCKQSNSPLRCIWSAVQADAESFLQDMNVTAAAGLLHGTSGGSTSLVRCGHTRRR